MVAIKMPQVGRKTRFRTPTQEELEELRDRLAPFFDQSELLSPLSPSLDRGLGELTPFSPPVPPKPSGAELYTRLASLGYPGWSKPRGHAEIAPEQRLLTPRGIPPVESLREFVLEAANLTPEAKAYLRNVQVGTTTEENIMLPLYGQGTWGGRFNPLKSQIQLKAEDAPLWPRKELPRAMAHELGHAWDFSQETPFGIRPSIVPRSSPTRMFSHPEMWPLIKDYLTYVVGEAVSTRTLGPIAEWYAGVVEGHYPNKLEDIPADIRPLFAGLFQAEEQPKAVEEEQKRILPSSPLPEPGIDLAEEQARVDALRRQRRLGEPVEPGRLRMPSLPGGIGERLGRLATGIGELPTPSPFAPSEAMTVGELAGQLAEPVGKATEWYGKKVLQPAGGVLAMSGLGVSPYPESVKEQMRRRVKEHMAEGKNLWEALGAAQEERPETIPGEKFFQEFLADPANLIGLGWEPNVARMLARNAAALAKTVEASGQPVRRVGTQIAKEVVPSVRKVLTEERGGLSLEDIGPLRNHLESQLDDLTSRGAPYEETDKIAKQLDALDIAEQAIERELGEEGAGAIQEGLEATLRDNPLTQYTWLVSKTGKEAGKIPENLSISQFVKLNNKRPLKSQQTGKFGRLPNWIVVDEKADELGMTTDDFIKGVNEAYRQLTSLPGWLQRQVLGTKPQVRQIVRKELPAEIVPEARVGQVQAGEEITQGRTGLADIGGIATTITENMYKDLWQRLQTGKVLVGEANPRTFDYALRQAFKAGRIKSIEDIKQLGTTFQTPPKVVPARAAELGGLTKEAEDLLANVDAGGVPSVVTKNLERILRANGIEEEAIRTRKPEELIGMLRAKRAAQPTARAAEAVPAARLTSQEIREATDLGIPLQPPGNEEAMRTAIREGKERGLSGRMRQAATVTFPDGSVISKEAQDVLQRDILTYDQLTNKATRAEADRRIAADYTGTLAELLDLSKPSTPDLIDAGVRFLEQGSREDLALFQDVLAAMSARGTGSGRISQIFSEIKTISQEGAMLEAHKTLQKMLTTKGGKITLAEEKQLAKKGIEVQREVVTAEGQKIITDAQALAKFQLEQARAARDIAKVNWQEAQRTLRVNLRTANKVEQVALRANWREQERLWKEAEKRLTDMQVLTGRLVPEAVKRARNLERAAVNYGKQAVAKNGLALSDMMANNLMERARFIQALAPGLEQNRQYEHLMQDIANFVPPSKRLLAMDLYGLPISLKTAWDAGVMFRQGALLGSRHPDIWLREWGSLIKYYADPAFADQIQTQLATRPLANVVDEMGGIMEELWERTEFFSSKVALKLPGLKGSQRSFVVPMNKIRLESIDKVIMGWLPKGYDLRANPINTLEELTAVTGKSAQEAKDVALLYNALSGKSNLPWLKAQAPTGILRLPFFAAGWALSIPEAFGRTAFSPGARKEGARILGGYFGFVTAAEMMGDLVGIWDAELDPRSSNFGKVRFKGTSEYIDPTLGMSAWLRLVAQMLPTPGPQGWQPYHKTTTGKLTPQRWQDAAVGRFLRGKSHPILGELWAWAEGQNIVGEKRLLSGPNAETALSVFNSAKSLFAPLTPVDVVEGVINDGLIGGVIALSNIVGLNVQSYRTFRDQQQRATDSLYPGKKFEELDRGQQRQVNDSPEIKIAIAEMDTQGDLGEKVNGRYENYNEANTVLEIGRPATEGQPAVLGLQDHIRAGMKGQAMTQKIKDFKRDRYMLAQAMLTPDVLAYSTQDKTLKPHDIYADLWLNVELEEDVQTGELNFEKQTAERDAILREAQPSLKAAGYTSDYITKRGEGTFRGPSAKDPEVAKALDEYDADIETLKPYYALREDLLKRISVYANAVENYERAEAQQDMNEMLRWKRPYNAFNNLLSTQREVMRNRDREIYDAGARLGRWQPRLRAPAGSAPSTLPSLKVGTGIKAGTPIPVGR